MTDFSWLKRSDWDWSERWRRSSFLQAYGDHTFEASYAATKALLRLSGSHSAHAFFSCALLRVPATCVADRDVPYKDNFYGREHGRGENHTLRDFFESLPPATESPPEEAP